MPSNGKSEGAVCPESTLESARRRDFIKKAAIVTAAGVVGGSVIGHNIVPQSDASSANCVTVTTPTSPNPSGSLAVWGGCANLQNSIPAVLKVGFRTCPTLTLCNPGGSSGGPSSRGTALCATGCAPCAAAIYAENPNCGKTACSCGYGPIGIHGNAPCGVGLFGTSCSGFAAVYACAGWPCKPGQTIGVFANSLKGIGVCAVSGVCLGINAASGKGPVIGKFSNLNGCPGDKSALLQIESASPCSATWGLGVSGKCNPSKVPIGSFYFQRSGCTHIPISINKCGYVGINNLNPIRRLCVTGRVQASCGFGIGTQTIYTTLAVNGSVSVKSRVATTGGNIALSDYVVLAKPSSSAIKLTLPTVASTAGACNGMMLFIKKIDSTTNSVTIAPVSGDSIEGNTTGVVLSKPLDFVQLVSNNSNGGHEWFIIASYQNGAFVS